MNTSKKIVSLVSQGFPNAVFFHNTERKVISITIDDVPARDEISDLSTMRILDTLKNFQTKVTFFVTTKHITAGSKIVEIMSEQSHEIGNHGTTDHPHVSLSAQEFEDEFIAAHNILSGQIDQPIRWFRPGQAFFNQSMLQTLTTKGKQLGYQDKFALASMIPFDTREFLDDPDFTLKNIKRFIFPGSILVLHGGKKIQVNNTVKVLEMLLPFLKEKKYEVVTLSNLILNDN